MPEELGTRPEELYSEHKDRAKRKEISEITANGEEYKKKENEEKRLAVDKLFGSFNVNYPEDWSRQQRDEYVEESIERFNLKLNPKKDYIVSIHEAKGEIPETIYLEETNIDANRPSILVSIEGEKEISNEVKKSQTEVQDLYDANLAKAEKHFRENEEAYKQQAVNEAHKAGKDVNYPGYSPEPPPPPPGS